MCAFVPICGRSLINCYARRGSGGPADRTEAASGKRYLYGHVSCACQRCGQREVDDVPTGHFQVWPNNDDRVPCDGGSSDRYSDFTPHCASYSRYIQLDYCWNCTTADSGRNAKRLHRPRVWIRHVESQRPVSVKREDVRLPRNNLHKAPKDRICVCATIEHVDHNVAESWN